MIEKIISVRKGVNKLVSPQKNDKGVITLREKTGMSFNTNTFTG